MTEGNGHALTCRADSTAGCLNRAYRVRECRSLRCSCVLESDGLDRTAEKCMPLFHLIERVVQLRDDRLGFISDNQQFNIDLFV